MLGGCGVLGQEVGDGGADGATTDALFAGQGGDGPAVQVRRADGISVGSVVGERVDVSRSDDQVKVSGTARVGGGNRVDPAVDGAVLGVHQMASARGSGAGRCGALGDVQQLAVAPLLGERERASLCAVAVRAGRRAARGRRGCGRCRRR